MVHLTEPITLTSVARNNENFLFRYNSASEVFFINDVSWEEAIGDLRIYNENQDTIWTDGSVHVNIKPLTNQNHNEIQERREILIHRN